MYIRRAFLAFVVLAEREPPPLRVGRQVRGTAVAPPSSPLCRSGVCRDKKRTNT